ncbi:MAG: right-handed parallel beta-helix repeat-containing protein [Methylobacterium frigidaeris]
MLTRRHLLGGAGLGLLAATAGCDAAPKAGRVHHVAPGGSDAAGTGSRDRPFATLPRAYAVAEAGDRIVLRGGTYGFRDADAGWLLRGRGGRPGRPVVIENQPGEEPVIDGSGIRPPPGRGNAWATPKTAGGFPLAFWDTPHVVLRGVTVRRGPIGGIHVNGRHDGFAVERCVTHDNGWFNDEHGVGLGLFGEGHGNVVRDCDSYGNGGGGPGATGGNADGFQIVLLESTGTVVAGNRAWRNGDDGFDFFVTSRRDDDRSATGYVVDGNWSFENGCHPDGRLNPGGDGVGFKLGGRRPGSRARHGGHLVTRCIAWGNKSTGFDDNGYNGGTEPHTVFNNTAFDNGGNTDRALGAPGFAFVFSDNPLTRLCNNVAFATQDRNALHVGAVIESHNARNLTPWNAFSPALDFDRSDFVTLDDAPMRAPRGRDGALPASGFLRPGPASRLRGRGTAAGLPGHIAATGAPDLGAFQAV